MKTILTLFTLCILCSTSYCQTQDRKYVRIIVTDATTVNAAQEIDQFMRLQSGVLTSRMDRRTSIYLGIFDASAGLDAASFIQWIQDLGYTPTCSVEGSHGDGTPMIPMTREICNGHPSELQEKN